jgi:hypothetical protein
VKFRTPSLSPGAVRAVCLTGGPDDGTQVFAFVHTQFEAVIGLLVDLGLSSWRARC